MTCNQFSQEQKMTILRSAAKIGVRQAADLVGAHYNGLSVAQST